MILTIVRAAFPVLDILGPQIPPPPPPPAPVVIVAKAPVPCDQVMADGAVYCGTPGSEPQPEKNPALLLGAQTGADAVTRTDEGHGFPMSTGRAEIGTFGSAATSEQLDYFTGLENKYCAALPWRCE